MPELRIGIVGAGGIVRDRHLPNLEKMPDVEIVAVANSSLESAKIFCEERVPKAEAMGDWQALVARDDIDIVWIGATPHLHCPVTLAALEAGHHVFCQARMARNLVEAQQMSAAAKAKPKLVTMLCPPPVGLRRDRFIRGLLESDQLGEIRSIELRSLSSVTLDPDQPAHWRQRKDLSGNNIMTLGIYTEVLQRWLGKVRSVSATGRVWTPEREGIPIEIPEQLEVTVEFGQGGLGVMRLSSVYPGSPEETLAVVGSRDTLWVNFATDEVLRGRNHRPLTPPPELDRPWQVERDFIEAVKNPDAERPHPSFEDGVAYMAVVDAVAQSLTENRRIQIVRPD